MSDSDIASAFQKAWVRISTDSSRSAVGRTIAKLPGGNAVLQQLFYKDPAPDVGQAHLLLSFTLPRDTQSASLEETKAQLLKWASEQTGIPESKGTVIDEIEQRTKHLHISGRATMQGQAMALARAPHNQFVVKFELPESKETKAASDALNKEFGKKLVSERA